LIISIVALVFAMVGTGYAAFKLPKKSVGTQQLKANAVTGAKVKNETLTGKKIKLKTLGVVPNAAHATAADTATTATTATTANALPAPELHVIGAPGQPGFLEGAHNISTEGAPFQLVPAAFFKDHDGVVHLEGAVEPGSGEPFLFTLPPGYRPASGRIQVFGDESTTAIVFGSNMNIGGVDLSGVVLSAAPEVLLSGLTFRAES
jgi:hypothetical protein